MGQSIYLNRNLSSYFHLDQGMLSQNPSPLTLLSFLLSPFLSRSSSPSAQSAEIVELLKRFEILNTRVDRRTFSSQHVALYTKNKILPLKLIFVLLIYYLKYHNSSTYITKSFMAKSNILISGSQRNFKPSTKVLIGL